MARRLYRKPVVAGVYRLDEGALLDDCFSCLRPLGMVDWLNDVRRTAIQRERVPVVQNVVRYSLKTLLGVDNMHTLPALGPICPDTLAENLVHLNVRDLEAWCNGVIRARAKAGGLAAKVAGIVDATDLETTAQDEGCGQATRQRKVTDKRGQVCEIEVTVYSLKPEESGGEPVGWQRWRRQL